MFVINANSSGEPFDINGMDFIDLSGKMKFMYLPPGGTMNCDPGGYTNRYYHPVKGCWCGHEYTHISTGAYFPTLIMNTGECDTTDITIHNSHSFCAGSCACFQIISDFTIPAGKKVGKTMCVPVYAGAHFQYCCGSGQSGYACLNWNICLLHTNGTKTLIKQLCNGRVNSTGSGVNATVSADFSGQILTATGATSQEGDKILFELFGAGYWAGCYGTDNWVKLCSRNWFSGNKGDRTIDYRNGYRTSPIAISVEDS